LGAGGRAFKSPRPDQNIFEHDRERAQEQLAQFRLSPFPGPKFTGVWFSGIRDLLGIGVGADVGTEAGHEFGHAGYLMQVGPNGRADPARSNQSALDLENAVRKARDPNAPVRTKH
jgi:hypothetical protein